MDALQVWFAAAHASSWSVSEQARQKGERATVSQALSRCDACVLQHRTERAHARACARAWVVAVLRFECVNRVHFSVAVSDWARQRPSVDYFEQVTQHARRFTVEPQHGHDPGTSVPCSLRSFSSQLSASISCCFGRGRGACCFVGCVYVVVPAGNGACASPSGLPLRREASALAVRAGETGRAPQRAAQTHVWTPIASHVDASHP